MGIGIHFLKHILKVYCIKKPASVLILGCGSANENISVNREINADCISVGIDIDFATIIKNQCTKNLVQMDGRNLGFKDNSFDCVFSYHALEHIPDYYAVLSEVKRVLRPNGIFLIGVPNKRRIIGYVDSDVVLSVRIKWNIADYLMRIKGRFENSYGAHAGFTQKELKMALGNCFTQVCDLTNEYYFYKYGSRKFILQMLIKFGVGSFLFPSIYFICINCKT